MASSTFPRSLTWKKHFSPKVLILMLTSLLMGYEVCWWWGFLNPNGISVKKELKLKDSNKLRTCARWKSQCFALGEWGEVCEGIFCLGSGPHRQWACWSWVSLPPLPRHRNSPLFCNWNNSPLFCIWSWRVRMRVWVNLYQHIRAFWEERDGKPQLLFEAWSYWNILDGLEQAIPRPNGRKGEQTPLKQASKQTKGLHQERAWVPEWLWGVSSWW